MIKCDTLNAGKIAKIIGLASLFSLAACNSNNNDSKITEENPSGEDSIVVKTEGMVSDSSTQVVEKDTVVEIKDTVATTLPESKAETEVKTVEEKKAETPVVKTVEKKSETPAVKPVVKKKKEPYGNSMEGEAVNLKAQTINVQSAARPKVSDDDDFEPPYAESTKKVVVKTNANAPKTETNKKKTEENKKKDDDYDYMW